MEEALDSAEAENWKKAIEIEMETLGKMGTWVMEDLPVVMKAGHPRANFSPPAPAPANTRTRRYGSGIPADTGVGSCHSHGFANRNRFILRVTNTNYNVPIILYHIHH